MGGSSRGRRVDFRKNFWFDLNRCGSSFCSSYMISWRASSPLSKIVMMVTTTSIGSTEYCGINAPSSRSRSIAKRGIGSEFAASGSSSSSFCSSSLTKKLSTLKAF